MMDRADRRLAEQVGDIPVIEQPNGLGPDFGCE
jgi:hypothetical protein